MKKIIQFLILLIIVSCTNKKNTYYKTSNGQIITQNEFDKKKKDINDNEKLIFTKTEQKNDSIIKSFEFVLINPWIALDKFIGKELPFENLRTIDDEKFDLSSIKGKPTIINIWFIECPPCIEEMPTLNKYKEKYGDKLNYIAISRNGRNGVKEFLKTHKFDFIHITNADSEISKLKNEAYPVNLFLDKNGVLKYYEGMLNTRKESSENIEKLLKL